jgi:PAS domain S-box-containing protein
MDKPRTSGHLPQKSGFYFDLHSLSGQIIISSIILVILTATIAVLPVLWIIREQLGHQAWSQIEQGYHAAQSLYKVREHRLDSFASLSAQNPSLAEILENGDPSALTRYLESLKMGEEMDFLAICDPDQQLIATTSNQLPEDLCAPRSPGSYYLVSGQTLPQIWLVASQPIRSQTQPPPHFIIGLKLDSDFADQMRNQTGLEHSIMTSDRIVASSLSTYPPNQKVVAPRTSFLNTSDVVVCCTYNISDQTYYGARIQLDGGAVQAEIALPVTDISSTQRALGTVLAGSMLAVVALGSLLGVIFARRISKPLVELSESASRFSQGDLATPVHAESNVREVVQVSQALEQARLDLAKTLTELREEKAWVEHLLESIVEGIMTLDNSHRITFFSQGAERITGWMREEVLHHSCDEVFQLLEENTPFSQYIPLPGQKSQVVVQVADERQVILSITRAHLTPSAVANSEIALVFRDVSEEVAVHHLLGYFIANVAHEFRTPLSALAASIELLIDQAPTLSAGEVDELLKSLHLGVFSLQTLIDNLLESASIETGRFRVSPRVYDLDTILREAVQSMQPLLEKYEQQVILDIPADLPLVQADPRRVVQVLVNLISNANKYGPEGANIHILVARLGKMVKIQVADRGPGILSEYRELLFKRFEYPALTSNRNKVGAGLGLSVVKAVVEAHGGRVGMDDRLGGGSIFWFTLPLADES